MNEPAARPGRWWKYLLIATGIVLVAVLAALWYSTTNSFQGYVRRRMVEEVERITGGRAEIGSFHVVPFHLQVEVRNITVRGKEAPTEAPLAHADSLVAQLKIVSFLRTEFGFRSLSLERPVIHIVIGPDGTTTNIPAFQFAQPASENNAVEQLFALSIDHLSVHNGELLWADQKIPLDFSVQSTNVDLVYSFLHGRYESHLALGKVDTRFEEFRPFSWMTTADFTLAPTFADIKSLRWNSGRSSAQLNGRISDFRQPRLDGSYDAHVDMEEAGAIAREADLHAGIAEFKGNGHWSLSEFATSGSAVLRGLEWQDNQFVVKKIEASTDYQVTDQQIKLWKLQGKLLGGSFSGDAQVENWLHNIPPASSNRGRKEDFPVISAAKPALKKGEKPKLPGVQSGVVHLRVRDVSVGEVAAALDVRAHPLGRFHPAGAAAGNVEALWRGAPRNTEVGFGFDVNPPTHPGARELPMTAHLQGKYRVAADSLELTQFNLTTPASKIVASGTLAASSALHFSISTSNLEEWRPLVAALGGPTNVPFRVNGNATFNGVAGGTFSSPTLGGTLVADDFEFTVPATSQTPEKPVHWDSFAANIQFSSHELSLRGGSLRRGDTSADFEVNAVLQKGRFTENSPYTAQVNLHNVDVASTAALAGFDYPVSGTADVSLQIAGTRALPHVQGHIRAANASAYGEAIEKFDADLQVGSSETTLSNIRSHPPGCCCHRKRCVCAFDARLPPRSGGKKFRSGAGPPDSSGRIASGRSRRLYADRIWDAGCACDRCRGSRPRLGARSGTRR